jgi:transposase
MEATNTYGHVLARYLYRWGHQVSIVYPSRIKG